MSTFGDRTSERSERLDAVDLLLKSDLLADVDGDTLRNLAHPPEMIDVAAGDTIIQQNKEGEAYYLLVHGRLRVFVEGEDGTPQTVGEVMPGEGVGEMSLLTDDPTSATVRAMHDSRLVRFSRESYMQLMESSSRAALQVTRTVIRRLRQGMAKKNHHARYSTITFLPLDTAVDMTGFMKKFFVQLAPLQQSALATPDILSEVHRAAVNGRGRLSDWDDHNITNQLIALEAESEIVVYQADFEPTEWTRLCIRQADFLVLLTTVDSSPDLTEAEKKLVEGMDSELAPRKEVVMVHPEGWRQKVGAMRWLSIRHGAECHHLRIDRDQDYARLARIITGQANNLVLGGGGARGMAQIGILKAMKEAGLPVDRIGGTSAGSFIGALYASDMDFDSIIAAARHVFIEGNALGDYTFPAISLIRGRRIHNKLKNLFGDRDIEDLPRSFFCVSGNLTDVALRLHDRGPLWIGVRASMSLPGVGPPMFEDGKLLIDGGVLNNLPGDIMQERYGGTLTIVDVAPQVPISAPLDVEETISGWRILANRLNPFTKNRPYPSMFEILYQSATLSSGIMAKRTYERADILMTPPLQQFATLEFEKIDEIIDIGYRYAADLLEKTDLSEFNFFKNR